MDKEKAIIDAGLRSLDHYKVKLPAWRYHLRELLLPLVRWETPYLAWLQTKLRSQALDSYFAFAANLGTHTFFMIGLPILFWCGHTGLGRCMVHVLAEGVFVSGFFKDMLCLPRPLSPPLQRITMSDSAALEYGFPSTHSTNAVSVAVYSLLVLNSDPPNMSPSLNIILQILLSWYACSIVLGRLYCGMHGYVDVIAGSLLGAALAWFQYVYGSAFDDYIHSGSIKGVAVVILLILILVRIHPEPADNCPCFDDSVAFAGVMIGVEFGNWHFARSGYAWSEPVLATVPFSIEAMGWPVVILRILVGVIVIFVWRALMKPTLLRTLPPVFRVIEAYGLNLPRRFFMQASQYTKVPRQHKDDEVIPSISDIPNLLRRRRAVSIGPQSEADAYETLAYREHRRRSSLSGGQSPSPPLSPIEVRPGKGFRMEVGNTSRKPDIATFESMMGTGVTSGSVINHLQSNPPPPRKLDMQELGEKELFSNLQKPRVRYDVEVVTKLIVYSGIAWLATEGNPLLFYTIGLGL